MALKFSLCYLKCQDEDLRSLSDKLCGEDWKEISRLKTPMEYMETDSLNTAHTEAACCLLLPCSGKLSCPYSQQIYSFAPEYV